MTRPLSYWRDREAMRPLWAGIITCTAFAFIGAVTFGLVGSY